MPYVDKLRRVGLNLDTTPCDIMPCVDKLHRVELNRDITHPTDRARLFENNDKKCLLNCRKHSSVDVTDCMHVCVHGCVFFFFG